MWNTIAAVALPLVMSVYVGVAEKAVSTTVKLAAKRKKDPVAPFLFGELTDFLTTAQLAIDDMVRITNNYVFEPSTETANEIFVRKTIVARAVLATTEKALEASGGAGFFRKFELERMLRDVHAGQFHPLQEKRQQLFTGNILLGLDQRQSVARNSVVVAQAGNGAPCPLWVRTGHSMLRCRSPLYPAKADICVASII